MAVANTTTYHDKGTITDVKKCVTPAITLQPSLILQSKAGANTRGTSYCSHLKVRLTFSSVKR